MARVLLVDDEKMARVMYGDFLSSAGHEVVAVGSLAEFRRALERERFDVVVTDLILPEGDGLDVLQYAKGHRPGVEVIVITALDKVSPAVRALKSGAAEYLIKPVEPEVLQHAVSRALTSQSLLRENASLREYVALLEAGQRISTVLDKKSLLATAPQTFAQVTAADAVALFSRAGEGRLAHEGSLGLTPEEELALVSGMEEQLPGAGQATRLAPAGGYSAVWAYPASESGGCWGHVVLLFRSEPPETMASSAAYLAKHLALAWRTLSRFAQVEDLAYLDDLTQVFNRRYLDLILERELKSAQQGGGTFSLLFLDLDHFKSVNDTHGHLAGSKLLVEVARLLKRCVRDNDVLVRYGGDEYVVLLRTTDSSGALRVAERIRQAFETHRFLTEEGLSAQVTACIGVASFPEHAADEVTLLDLADRAMYRGKKSTRNVVYVASEAMEATPASRHGGGAG